MAMLKLAAVALVATVSLWALPTFAQRDAGAKARGEFGGGFYNSGRSLRSTPRHYTPPARPAMPSTAAVAEDHRSYSYAPIGVYPGDAFSVNSDRVRLMRGRSVIGTLPRGQELTAIKVVGGWIGTSVEVDGERLSGWVWHRDVHRLEYDGAQ